MTPEAYVRRLRKALRPLPRGERERLVSEIRTHLDARGEEGLGPPEALARSFVEDHLAAQALAAGSPGGRAAAAGRRVLEALLAAASLVLVLALYVISLVAGLLGVGKLVAPQTVDAWRTAKGVTVNTHVGHPGAPPPPGAEDLSGWVAVIGTGVCVASFALATFILVWAYRAFVVQPLRRSISLSRMETRNV